MSMTGTQFSFTKMRQLKGLSQPVRELHKTRRVALYDIAENTIAKDYAQTAQPKHEAKSRTARKAALAMLLVACGLGCVLAFCSRAKLSAVMLLPSDILGKTEWKTSATIRRIQIPGNAEDVANLFYADVAQITQQKDFQQKAAGALAKKLPSGETAEELYRTFTVTPDDSGKWNITAQAGDKGTPMLLLKTAVAVINGICAQERCQKLAQDMKHYMQEKTATDAALREAWEHSAKVSRRIANFEANAKDRFDTLDKLLKEKHELEMTAIDMGIQMRHFLQKTGYEKIAERLHIGNESDIEKILVEGNILRGEWSKLESKLEKLQTRYTENHPAVQSLAFDINAIRQTLRENGEVTSLGKVPPLPRAGEIETIRKYNELKNQTEINRMRLAAIGKKITETESAVRTDASAAKNRREKKSDLMIERDEIQATLKNLQEKNVAICEHMARIETEITNAERFDTYAITSSATEKIGNDSGLWLVSSLAFVAAICGGAFVLKRQKD